MALVANKIDLYQDEQVSSIEGTKYADEINAIFQNTSALSNSGIDKLFENLGKKFIDPSYDYKNPGTEENISEDDKKSKKDQKGGGNDKNKIKLKNEKNGKKDGKKCCWYFVFVNFIIIWFYFYKYFIIFNKCFILLN